MVPIGAIRRRLSTVPQAGSQKGPPHRSLSKRQGSGLQLQLFAVRMEDCESGPPLCPVRSPYANHQGPLTYTCWRGACLIPSKIQ